MVVNPTKEIKKKKKKSVRSSKQPSPQPLPINTQQIAQPTRTRRTPQADIPTPYERQQQLLHDPRLAAMVAQQRMLQQQGKIKIMQKKNWRKVSQ